MNWMELQDQAIIGLVSIAITHIQNGDYDKAESTLNGLIDTMTKGDEEE